MATKAELEAETSDFFDRHWQGTKEIPQWDFSWEWCNAVPNYKLGGVYALFSGENLLYIGLGASRGGGIYKSHGLSRRLLAHVLKIAPEGSTTSYIPQEYWENCSVGLVATIGFPDEFSYLACALEDYLIGRLNPPENSVKKRKSA
jgi:hypothetical protein